MKPIYTLLLILSAQSLKAAEPEPVFEDHIRPLLKAHCFECHGEGKKLKGGLDVRLAHLLKTGGDAGPSVLVGKSKQSPLIQRLRSGEMPPGKKKLTTDEIDRIARWIDTGAKTLRPEPAKLATGFQLSPEEESFWSFQPIRKDGPPKVKEAAKVRNPIDAFILAGLEAKKLTFSPEADRRTLIRRVYFDLLGLPPSVSEVETFLKDSTPNAYEKLIDRVLESPHYGERWGRHWLDVAGYADSEGYTGDDQVRSSAWRYRDYVIRAINSDMPWDRFLTEQLAGDELVSPPYTKIASTDFDKLIATGFLRMAPDGTGVKDVDKAVASNQTIADTLQIVGTSILGITLHCAQCHNHRYDPIPQLDYYKTRAIFEPAFDWKNWRAPLAREIKIHDEEGRKKIEAIEAQAVVVDKERIEKTKVWVKEHFDAAFAKVPDDKKADVKKALATAGVARTAEQKELLTKYKGLNVDAANIVAFDPQRGAEIKKYLAKAKSIRDTAPAPASIRAATELPGQIPVTHLFERGDHEQPSDEVSPGHLTMLGKFNLPAIAGKSSTLQTSGRRLAFAKSLVEPDHPLTSRVLVNRFWMHHFGRGIVSTPSDFGFLGERPSHPELLDWLARDFTSNGWKLKRLHKLMMTSATYRQSSIRSPELQELDPDNRLWGRMQLRRLAAEELRDAMLAVNGKLNSKAFGPPVPIMTDDTGQVLVGVDTNDGAGRPTGKFVPLNGEEFRRSVYVQVRRSKPLAMLEAFDAAMPTPNTECRNASTVTPQSLMLMNSKMVLEQADLFAKRLETEAGKDAKQQVRLAWKLAFTAEASQGEVDASLRFITEQTAQLKDAPKALANFCQALLTANRFLYVD